MSQTFFIRPKDIMVLKKINYINAWRTIGRIKKHFKKDTPGAELTIDECAEYFRVPVAALQKQLQ